MINFHAIVVMGVCGCGKTTVGMEIAKRLRIEFKDADDFHPAANVEKMRMGIPLEDADREPWCALLRQEIETFQQAGKPFVLACSALRQVYRDWITPASTKVAFVYLKGDWETLSERLSGRDHQYMPSSLLRSQLNALEEPKDAIVADIRLPVNKIAESVVSSLKREI